MNVSRAVMMAVGIMAFAMASPITSVPLREQLFGKSGLFCIFLSSVSSKPSIRLYKLVSLVQLLRIIWLFEYARVTSIKMKNSANLTYLISPTLSYEANRTLTFLTGVRFAEKQKDDEIIFRHLCYSPWCR